MSQPDPGVPQTATPTQVIEQESRNRVRDHLSRTARFNPTRSLRQLTSQLTQEYEDRFLIELVQNAYDALAADGTTGRILVRLDEACLGGPVLYVANTGRPFTTDNFDSLTNVAQSSKPPGEGIGNKGVGFRSVLQVCSFPEVYSSNGEPGTDGVFGGFCFGFATDDQIRGLVVDDEQFELVRRDFSRHLLPVPAIANDPALSRLRQLGMVTVIRLPLSDESALRLAREQISRLREPSAPIALFLDRLNEIVVEHIDESGSEERFVVERKVTQVVSEAASPTIRTVETAGGRFLVTSKTLEAEVVRGVVLRAIEERQLDASWGSWNSSVDVALAVSLDGDTVEAPVTYTYLPMRVKSPVRGHLHAPFHTKIARLDLNERSLLNTFLVEEAIQLASDTVAILVSDSGVRLALDIRQRAAVDLMCWDARYSAEFEVRLRAAGLDLRCDRVLPTRGPAGPGWGAVSETRLWPHDGLSLLADETVRRQVTLLDSSIGTRRLEHVLEWARTALGQSLLPSDSEAAGWVEAVAAGLGKVPPTRWNRFLDEVATVFAGRDARALQGRMILLDEKRRIRRTGPWASGSADPTVFIPPVPQRPQQHADRDSVDETLRVPKNLQRALTYLHPDIRVRARDGSSYRRTAVGELLARGDLVQPFELAAVLSHLERLLSSEVSDSTYRQSLRWVYVQETASRANINDLARIGLRVPTRQGWVPAGRAVFSVGWRTPKAKTLQAYVDAAADESPSVARLGERALLDPAEWPFTVNDHEAMRDFLLRCGVQDGLHPQPMRTSTPIRMNGISYTGDAVASRFGLKDPGRIWRDLVEESKARWLAGPYTPYTGDSTLWLIPGQEEFESMTSRARDLLALCLTESMPDWPEESWTYAFRRRSSHHLHKQDPQVWPSPAAAFVGRAPWFPMANSKSRDEHYFVPVGAGWTFDEDSNESAPRFARLAPIEVRRRISGSARAQRRLADLGLHTWNAPASASARLSELASLTWSGDISDGDVLLVRRAAVKAWSDVASSRDLATAPTDLLVARGSSIDVLAGSTEQPPTVFVHDVGLGLVSKVLEAAELPVLLADPNDGPAIKIVLERSAQFRLAVTSAVQAEVVLDGQRLAPSPDVGQDLVSVFGAWFVPILLAILEVRSSRFVRVTEKVLGEVEARLRRVRIATGTSFELIADGRQLSGGRRFGDCVHVDDAANPLLVLASRDTVVPSWRALESMSDDLAELIGQPQISSEIRAAALSLERRISEWREPTQDELATALRTSGETIAEVLGGVLSTADHLRWLVVPIVGCWLDPVAALRLSDGSVTSQAELIAKLTEMVGEERAAHLIDSAVRSSSVEALWRETGVPLESLNTVLNELGRPQLTFPDQHRAALQHYLSEHRREVFDRLRSRFYSAFVTRDSLEKYAEARSFRSLQPDPEWLPVVELPTIEMLQVTFDRWLDSVVQATDSHVPQLVPVDEVRRENDLLLDTTIPTATRLVRAWCTKADTPVPISWEGPSDVRDRLGASGCLDFERLDEPGVLGWLAALALWPVGMPLTLGLRDLGLLDGDLESARGSEAHTAEERRRRKTQVTFMGVTFDTQGQALRDLAMAVERSIRGSFLESRAVVSRLDSVTTPPSTSARANEPAGPAGRSYQSTRPTQEQATAIGLVGETLAYHWLLARYPDATPESWVSSSRTVLLGGHPGDDSLGYDLRVNRRSDTLLFEVKTTTTDLYEFDIGESELRAARQARVGQYRIIFISEVLDPDRRRLIVLPNPLEATSVGSYVQLNQGVRLRFSPKANPSR